VLSVGRILLVVLSTLFLVINLSLNYLAILSCRYTGDLVGVKPRILSPPI
jgi:hypothetical protein